MPCACRIPSLHAQRCVIKQCLSAVTCFPGYHYSLKNLYSYNDRGLYNMRARLDLEGALLGSTLFIFAGEVPWISPAVAAEVYRYDISTNTLTGPVTPSGTMPDFTKANIGRSVTVIGTDVRFRLTSA